MIHALAFSALMIVAAFGLWNAGAIGVLAVERSHYKRKSAWLFEQLVEATVARLFGGSA